MDISSYAAIVYLHSHKYVKMTNAYVCVITFETWSCMHLEGNTACSPSVLGLRHRSCHRCGRSWRSRSWWRLCPGSEAQWGSSHMTAPSSPPPWGWVLDWTLQKVKGKNPEKKSLAFLLSCFFLIRVKISRKYCKRNFIWELGLVETEIKILLIPTGKYQNRWEDLQSKGLTLRHMWRGYPPLSWERGRMGCWLFGVGGWAVAQGASKGHKLWKDKIGTDQT